MGLVSMVYRYFYKNTASLAPSVTQATQDKSASSGAIKKEIISNKELPQELHKTSIRKLKKTKKILIIYLAFNKQI